MTKVLFAEQNTVLLNSPVTAIAPTTPKATQAATVNAAPAPVKSKDPNRISVGNLPLQGTIALVTMAHTRSHG